MAAAVGFPAVDLKEANAAEWKELANMIQCWRCGGLMVTEQCFDLLDDTVISISWPGAACSAVSSWIRSSSEIAGTIWLQHERWDEGSKDQSC